MAVSSLMPYKVLATDNSDFYSLNDILFYDENATGCTGSPTTTTGTGTTSVTGAAKDRLEAILKFYTEVAGLSFAAAAGVAGNMDRETGGTFDPTLLQGGKQATGEGDIVKNRGIGLIQWSYPSRQDNLVSYAHSVGGTALDFQVQLDFTMIEANTGFKDMMNKLYTIKTESPFVGSNNVPVSPEKAAAIMWNGTTQAILDEGNEIINAVGIVDGSEKSSSMTDGLLNRADLASKIYNTYLGQYPDGVGVTDPGTVPNTTGFDCNSLPSVQSGNIIQTALLLAWPEPVLDEVDAVKAFTPKPEYVAARQQYNRVGSAVDYTDCGQFVATVMIMSGADPNYTKTWTKAQREYLIGHPEKYIVTYNPSISDLAPGDIVVYYNSSTGRGHTYFYYGDATYPTIEAARDTRVPSVQEFVNNWVLREPSAISARPIK